MAGLRNYWDRVEATYHVKVGYTHPFYFLS